MKKGVVILFAALLTTAAMADTSAWHSIDPVTGSGSNSAYSQQASGGGLSSAGSSNSLFESFVGFIAGIFAPAPDTNPPVISQVLVDGREVRADDYVAADAEVTATVTDETAMSLANSYVAAGSEQTAFNALSGDSSYVTSSGALTWKLNISTDGDHSLSIFAEDTSGNTSSHEVSVKVDTGSVKVLSAYAYPNPYDPSAGNAKLAYMLSKDANITIYIFNAINQPVWKRNYLSGADGGHAGYNEVLWNGVSDFGQVVGNDIYFVRLVADGKKVIGRIKVAVVQ
ncbi:hypothetical protein ACFL4J_01290 [Candidatus Margulisiibacteriota bacterium]